MSRCRRKINGDRESSDEEENLKDTESSDDEEQADDNLAAVLAQLQGKLFG
jgi:hypothetical protein